MENNPEKLLIEVEEIKLENVTLQLSDNLDPILQSVDFNLPTDQVLLIESTYPANAVAFLQLLSGKLQTSSGKVLWNNENIFNSDSVVDPRDTMGCYFENYRAGSKETLKSVLYDYLGQEEFEFVVDYFDLKEYVETELKSLPYSFQKMTYLIKSAARDKQVLILEDPASGVDESQWLAFLDYIQLRQRRGYLRHVFMTNCHPTAMRHLGHNKIFIEDGLIYSDEQDYIKKASHF